MTATTVNSSSRCGILYAAFGPSFIDEAKQSAASSRQHNRIAHVIFADSAVSESDGVDVRVLERPVDPYCAKIEAMMRTPFERTLFLDTDTCVIGNVEPLFGLLEKHDLAAAHAPGYLGCDDPEVPSAFYEFNTGVIAYRATPRVINFLEVWRETYGRWINDPPFPGAGKWDATADQPAFRRCAWESELRVCVLGPEYNYRTIMPGRLVGRAKILHGRCADYAMLARVVNLDIGARCFPPFPLPLSWGRNGRWSAAGQDTSHT